MFDSWVTSNNQEYQTYLTDARHIGFVLRFENVRFDLETSRFFFRDSTKSDEKRDKRPTCTWTLFLGLSESSFLAAASMEAAAPSSSFSAITVGSSGSTQSEPAIAQSCIERHNGTDRTGRRRTGSSVTFEQLGGGDDVGHGVRHAPRQLGEELARGGVAGAGAQHGLQQRAEGARGLAARLQRARAQLRGLRRVRRSLAEREEHR